MEPQKLKALELLLLGKSNSAVARALEVDRSTIARWRQESEFAEIYQAQKSELQSEVKERLGLLMNQALDVCEKALEEQDIKVALKLLERFDRQQEKEEDKDSLPRLIVNIVDNPPMPIMTLDEMIAYNKSLPGPDPEFIELSERIRQNV